MDFYSNFKFPPYEFKPFPQMLYHDDHGTKVVADKAELDEALAEGWQDHPSKAPKALLGLGKVNILTDDQVKLKVEELAKAQMKSLEEEIRAKVFDKLKAEALEEVKAALAKEADAKTKEPAPAGKK